MSGTDFIAPELNVDNINTGVSGEFVHGDVQTSLETQPQQPQQPYL